MKRFLIFIVLIIAIGAALYYYLKHNPYFNNQPVSGNGTPTSMNISSSAFKNEQPIPSKYTCDGENISPPLTISNAPYGAKSLAIVMEDPDSPNKNFTHWVMFNIDPYLTNIPENFSSQNVTLGHNDFGNLGYGGPCPQSGMHMYKIEVYALNTILLLQKGASKQDLLNNMQGHIIEQAETLGSYKKL